METVIDQPQAKDPMLPIVGGYDIAPSLTPAQEAYFEQIQNLLLGHGEKGAWPAFPQ